MLKFRRKYFLVQDQEFPRTNKTIRAPFWGMSKRYVKLDETYSTSLSRANKHFSFLGWALIGVDPWMKLTVEERVALLDE